MIPNSHFLCNIFVPLRLTNFDHLFEHLLRDVLTIEEFVASIESLENAPKEVEDDHKLGFSIKQDESFVIGFPEAGKMVWRIRRWRTHSNWNEPIWSSLQQF
jgi:hypothetical protein